MTETVSDRREGGNGDIEIPDVPMETSVSAEPPSTPGHPPYPGFPDDQTQPEPDSVDPPTPYSTAIHLPTPDSPHQNGLHSDIHIQQPTKQSLHCRPLLQGLVHGSALPTRYRPQEHEEAGQESGTQEQRPLHHLALAVFTTLCMCPILGAVAIIYSCK